MDHKLGSSSQKTEHKTHDTRQKPVLCVIGISGADPGGGHEARALPNQQPAEVVGSGRFC